MELEERIDIVLLMALHQLESKVQKEYGRKYNKCPPPENVIKDIFNTFKLTGNITNMDQPDDCDKIIVVDTNNASEIEEGKNDLCFSDTKCLKDNEMPVNFDTKIAINMKEEKTDPLCLLDTDLPKNIEIPEIFCNGIFVKKEEEEELSKAEGRTNIKRILRSNHTSIENKSSQKIKPECLETAEMESEELSHIVHSNDVDTGIVENTFCSICNINFEDPVDYFIHNLSHARKGPYRCFKCAYVASTKINFRSHVILHRPVYTCSVCGVCTKLKEKYFLHLSKHPEEYQYDCPLCDFRARSSKEVQQHCKDDHDEKPSSSCDSCVLKFETCSEYQIHMETHGPKSCSVCSFQTFYSEKLTKHFNSHTKAEIQNKILDPQQIFKCSDCNYSSHIEFYLNRHKLIHTDEKKFECAHCSYKCIQSSYLRKHMRIHSQEKPYACSYCSYRTRSKGTLTTHIRTHTNEKPYFCSQCPFASKTGSALTRHIRCVHSRLDKVPEPKTRQCNLCPKLFSRKYDLMLHLRAHTGEKPYPCPLCPYSSTSSAGRLKHTRRIHGRELRTRRDEVFFMPSARDI